MAQRMHNNYPIATILDVCFSHNPEYNSSLYDPA